MGVISPCRLQRGAPDHPVADLTLKLLRLALLVLAVEALDTASGVEYLLLAREERVAVGADFNVNVALVRAAGQKVMTASALHADFVIGRVSLCLHGFLYVRQVPAWNRHLRAEAPGRIQHIAGNFLILLDSPNCRKIQPRESIPSSVPRSAAVSTGFDVLPH